MAVERARGPAGQTVRRFAPPANGAKRGVRLEWEGKQAEIDVPVLPFQTIETINEARQQLTLFSPPEDTRPALPPGWKNRLIWGDNKLAMAALAEEYAGQVDLIYIDPPFNTNSDFSVRIEVGDEAVTKEPSIIERHAYQDTWANGLDSYLQMMYERLLLMHELLSGDGTIYIHLDYHIEHYVKAIADSVFGLDNLRNEIIWYYTNKLGTGGNTFDKQHETLLVYVKGPNWQHVPLMRAVKDQKMQPVTKKIEGKRVWLRDDDGKRVYAMGSSETKIGDVWEVPYINPVASERLGYDTQKPEKLLEYVIEASSKPGDLVADFFVGSGTTAIMAERMGRRWIACDLGRFSLHTTRKRLLDWRGESGERCRAFEILNLGHYEQQFWQGLEGEAVDDLTAKKREQDYLRTMLAFYHARPLDGSTRIHGEKGGRAIHVGPLAESVSRMEAYEASEAALNLGFRKLDILGWEWDFESNETVKEDAKMRGVDLRLIQIPEEMLDGRARRLFQDGKLTFPELASLKVTVEPISGQPRTYRVHLDDFIIPPATLPEALRDRVTRWQDYIDYWSVDWEYGTEPPPFEKTFQNMWQDFRTRGKRTLTVTSENHTYTASGPYTVVVKVVDIFGNDTTVSRKVVVS